ncbi:hypothetical protein [Sphingobium sp. HWE2-09]|uniref:hypothetical protein n=1 Tax=Sphingobium sp. HWE2-09 TaxID=3108390 RepID=UPI002DCF3CE2|nr:hypothetical protein [Sphingobium sp. HWE2-09]
MAKGIGERGGPHFARANPCQGHPRLGSHRYLSFNAADKQLRFGRPESFDSRRFRTRDLSRKIADIC